MPRILKFRVRYIIEGERGSLIDWGYVSQYDIGKGHGRDKAWPVLYDDDGMEHHWDISNVHKIGRDELKFGSYPGAMKKPQFDWFMIAEDIADMIDGTDGGASAAQIWTATVDKPEAVIVGTVIASKIINLFRNSQSTPQWHEEFRDQSLNNIDVFVQYVWEFPYQLDADSWRIIKSGFTGAVEKFSKAGSADEIQQFLGTKHYIV